VPSYWHEMGYEAKRSWTHWSDGKVYKSRAVACYFFFYHSWVFDCMLQFVISTWVDTERSCSIMYRYQTKYQVVMTKTDLVFPIDVARRAMQIEEVNSAHKHRWQFCLKFRTLLRLTSVYLFNCAEPQGKQVSCSACGMTNFFYWTD
jgi:hypothetical protein